MITFQYHIFVWALLNVEFSKIMALTSDKQMRVEPRELYSMAKYWLPVATHLNDTPIPPLCYPYATLMPPLCHPYATLVPALCHLYANLLPPLCHLEDIFG